MLGIAILLLVLWVVVKIVFGIVGAVFHLLLVAAVLVGLVRARKGRSGAQDVTQTFIESHPTRRR